MQVAFGDHVWAAGVATELVNTAAEVWHGQDQLPDLVALAAFAERHDPGNATVAGALSERAHRGRPRDLAAVHALREVVRELIDRPDRDSLIAGATNLTRAAHGATLIADPADGDRTRWAVPLDDDATIADALSVICGIGILGVVHTLGDQRFRSCSAPTCRGVFIDTTRPGRRRYCMPGLCGNRTNVANHRARRAATRERSDG